MSDQVHTKKILIVDDSQMNRSILMDILENDFDILEAKDGVEAVQLLKQYNLDIALVLLDIVMPKMDGFGVLSIMNQYHWIESIPVMMISAETSSQSIIRAYELGATDFISRPFDNAIVYRRVNNTIMLYTKQKKLMSMVTNQIYENEKRNSMMVSILSHIVEFRNGESGLHVRYVQKITELLLKHLIQKTNQYHLSNRDITIISLASALHDIGKIAIDEKILNKSGPLTDEEFEIMKTHASIGASMLKDMHLYQNEELVKYAIEICRWHHERYDGSGYPDGLKGEDIPISAQVVSLADVYHALTSERVYKKAYSHEKAMNMIIKGECGCFNPLLLECLQEMSPYLENALNNDSLNADTARRIHHISDELHQYSELNESQRTLELLDYEREKYNFFAEISQEIQFEYTIHPSMLTLSPWSAKKLGVEENNFDILNNDKFKEHFTSETIEKCKDAYRRASLQNEIVTTDCQMKIDGQLKWLRMTARVIHASRDGEIYDVFVGKLVEKEGEDI